MNPKTILKAVAITMVIAGWSAGAGTWSLPVTANQAPEIVIDRASEVLVSPDSPAYLVAYHYKFADRTAVRIRAIGVVGAEGAFEHIVRDKTIDFLDVSTSGLLASIPVKPTIVVAAKPPLNEVPKAEAFPAPYRAYTWTQSTALPPPLDATLRKYFHYLPYEHDGRTYFATTYTPLKLAPELTKNGVLAQAALLLSFPYDGEKKGDTIHVQQLVKEGRSHSDEFRVTSNQQIVSAAEQFVDGLIAELSSPRSKTP
jgi:hypothetical protein